MKEKVSAKLKKIFLANYEQWCLLSFTYLQNKVEAEEVVQDVCVNILLREQSSEILNLKAYVSTAIKNRSLKKIKKIKRFETLNNCNDLASPSFEEVLIRTEKKLYIQKAVESLPDSTKEVFKLCVFEEQKYQNVADTMGISVNTVKYHIKKAYKILRVETRHVRFFWVIVAMHLTLLKQIIKFFEFFTTLNQ